MIKHGSGDRHWQPATHLANPRAALFGVHPGIPAKQRQTNPPDLDAEMMTRLPVATAFDSSYLLRHLPGAADTLCGMALADGRSPLIELHLNVNFSGCAYRQRARDQQNVVFGGRPGSDK